MKRSLMYLGIMAFLVSAFSYNLDASGMLYVKDYSMPPLAIKYQRVDAEIKDGVAVTHIEEAFQNSTDRQLEGIYIFPLPKGATVQDFAMYMNGKRTSGEIVEKNKAREIYQDIVRRMKDPGLLEYMGNDLFKASVFPIPPHGIQKMEISYSQILKFDSGLYQYIYPLKTDEKASTTLDDFTVKTTVNSKTPIKNIYSPSHNIGVTRKNDHEAVIGFEEDKSCLNRDFVLYYSLSDKEFGCNVMTHKIKDKDGFFMLMVSPSYELKDKDILKKDIVFVMDTSGSMSGEKIQQTKNALTYCVNKLNPDDRFNIVRFSTDTEAMAGALVKADKDNIKNALDFIGRMEARGGTAINEALISALSMKTDESRPFYVLFLTDGRPTIGETVPENILANIKGKSAKTRIFVFGAGNDVNTHLLDKVAEETGSVTEYVKPQEDIEVKVSSLFDKVSSPVISNLSLSIDNVKTYDIYPKDIPDIFKGTQLLVIGRYKDAGDTAIRLKGNAGGKDREFVYESTFQREDNSNSFIDRLWATRKVGYLLDEIRLRGSNKELVDEVTMLAKEYGIVTPYTSYLVLEDKDLGRIGMRGRGASSGNEVIEERESVTVDMPMSTSIGDMALIGVGQSGGGALSRGGRGKSIIIETDIKESMKAESGVDAIRLSEAIRGYKEKGTNGAKEPIKYINGRTFVLLRGIWIETSYTSDKECLDIKYASNAFFDILKKAPALSEIFALGENIILKIGSKYVHIQPDEGKEELSKEELDGLFTEK